MRYRQMGNSGLVVSVVGLGCNNFGRRLDEAGSVRVVRAALDSGITLFDTADVYGAGDSEVYLGKALGPCRQDAIIATKFGFSMGEGPYQKGASRRYMIAAVEASLRRLGTDYIDLYQLHTPDAETPIEETLDTFDTLVTAGKVRYAGCSNFAGWQIADAAWTSRVGRTAPFVSGQNPYSLLNRAIEREVVPACLRFGVGMIPYSPLANGMLTGKYRRGEPMPEGARLTNNPRAERFVNERNFEVVEELERFAASRDIDLLSVAIGALAAQPAVASVIAGAMSPEQVTANVRAGDWVPSDADLAQIDRIAPSQRPE